MVSVLWSIWFHYILQNVSFCVSPGEVVALVGPSGSGKTSCINLIEHFYETCTGSVLLDDYPIQSLDHTYLHTRVGTCIHFCKNVMETIVTTAGL